MNEYTPEKVAELVADLRGRAESAISHEATDALNAAADALTAVSAELRQERERADIEHNISVAVEGALRADLARAREVIRDAYAYLDHPDGWHRTGMPGMRSILARALNENGETHDR